MTKKFIKIPEGRFERIMTFATIAEEVSGNKTTQEEIFNQLHKEGIELTEEQIEQVKSSFE